MARWKAAPGKTVAAMGVTFHKSMMGHARHDTAQAQHPRGLALTLAHPNAAGEIGAPMQDFAFRPDRMTVP